MSTATVEQSGGQSETLRACLFVLGGRIFATEVRWAREVVVLEDHTVVPRTPAYLIGVVSLRGDIVPILDIRPLLGLPPGGQVHGSKALVLEAASARIAVPIEGVLGLASFDEITPVAEASGPEGEAFRLGRLRWRDEDLVTLLDVAKIVDTLRLGLRGTASGADEPSA